MDLLTLGFYIYSSLTLIVLLFILSLIKKNKVKEVLIAEMKIEEALGNIIQSTLIDRALLCKIHNGGGDITLGTEKKVSVISEPSNSLVPHTKQTYTSIPIDKAYKKVIIEMLEHPSFLFNESDKLPPGIFRAKTNADGITGVLHMQLETFSDAIFFVFLGTTNSDPLELLANKAQIGYIQEQVLLIRKQVKHSIYKRKFLWI